MGKGKGKFSRSVIKLKKYAKVLEFGGYKKISLVKFSKLLYKKTSLSVFVVSKSCSVENNIYNYYSKKYIVI